MGILDVVGELTGFTNSKAWTLEMIDAPNTKFVGQFTAENATENSGAEIAVKGALNADSPNKQWTGGESRTFTFDARLYARDSISSVASKIAQLREFSKKREDLGRAPIFTFTYGTELSFTCFIRSPGGIKYDEPRSDGSLRGASFSITLDILDDKLIEAGASLASLIKSVGGLITGAIGLAAGVGLISIPGGSLHTIGRTITAKDGDTFESIAAREYGDALVGDILRRTNVKIANIVAGDEVILVDGREIFQIEVRPQSNALKNGTEQNDLRRSFFELRGASKTVFI